MTKLKVEIDQDFCGGTGYCALLCPEVFEVDEEAAKARAIMPEVTDPALIEKVEEAELTCPMRAIVIKKIG